MKSTQTATAKIILETRYPGKDGKSPIKLRVTYHKKSRYYVMRYPKKSNDGSKQDETITLLLKVFEEVGGQTITLSKDDYKRASCEKPRGKYSTYKTMFTYFETKASNVIGKITPFSFERFESQYFSKPTDDKDIFSMLDMRSKELREEGRISTAIGYECTLQSLKKFTEKDKFPFENINVTWLQRYEKWMLKKENSLTTVGMYLRNVRAVYKKAESAGIFKPEPYPFGEDKYVIPTGRNIKKALTQEQVGLIANFKVIKGSKENRYRDYWLFSYLCNGINVKDMARLTYGNIEGDIIKLTRAKTEREKRHSPRPITIVITRLIGRIIDHWGIKPALPSQYIFPILQSGMTPENEYKAIQQMTKNINDAVGDIAEALELHQKVTTYTARHSFATVLKRSGASTEFISESLGHSNVLTTENYLSDFETDVKRQWAEKLTEF